MALPGGSADKLGNRYEGRWTVVCMAKVLLDQYAAIELEPPRSDGIEFKLFQLNGLVEHHQAKRQTSDGRSWTLGALQREGVLAALDLWTGDSQEFVFVSTSPVVADMTGLVAHARSAQSLAEFLDLVSAGSHASALGFLKQVWNNRSEEEIWLDLSRSDFRQADERTIRELAGALLLPVIDTDPDVVVRQLADFALDSVNQRLTGTRLWAFIDKSEIPRRNWANDPSVRAAVEQQRDRYVAGLEDATIRNHQLTRPQARQIARSLMDGSGPARILVSAPAGMGKSVLVAQAVQHLAADGVLILPFRLDRVEMTLRPDDLGAQLGLPGSPGRVLTALASGDPAVLVVDQLDAVSQVSGRNAPMLECIEEILREVAGFPNVRLLLAVRGFDLQADFRLRRLRDAKGTTVVNVEPLADEQVGAVLDEIGIDRAALSEDQLRLLRVPLNLRLLADGARHLSFGSVADLYEAFWTAKQLALRSRLGREPRWSEVIDTLCAVMTERQTLSVPVVAVDHLRPDVDAMISEHVLVQDGNRVLFFHEGFFDFAFAKRFAATGRALVAFLQTTDQGLFYRSQTRQILTYRRAADPVAYELDLAEILREPGVRFHLKALVIDWLGTVQEPSDREWTVLRDLLTNPADSLTERIVGLLARSPAWFDRADTAGDLVAWVDDPDEQVVDRAVWVCALMQRHRGSRITQLLRDRPCDDERWRQRYLFAAARADMTANEDFLNLVIDLVTAGCFDEVGAVHVANGSFWDLTHGLTKRQPAWTSRLARAFLERRIRLAQDAAVTNPFLDAAWIPDPNESDLFVVAATGDPRSYADELLPVVLTLLEANKRWDEDEGRWEDAVWRWRTVGRSWGVRDGLLHGMEIALARLATSDSDTFDRHRHSIDGLGFETTDYLLVRAFAEAPERYAETAAEFLLAAPSRLHAGYTNDGHWATRELLAAIYPRLPPQTRERLESMILGYYPSWERSVDGYQSHGRAQHTLLSGLPGELLTPTARSRRNELQRKFPFEPGPPRETRARRVEPPIPREKATMLSDAQWLRAIAKYSTDRMIGRADGRLAGGLHELAGLLHEQTTNEPVRFANLALRMPDTTNIAYFEAVLRGLEAAEVAVPPDLLFDVCRRCDRLPGRPCGRVITDPIAKHAGLGPLPDDIVQMVGWYATEDPDPAAPSMPADSLDEPDAERDGFDRTGLRLLERGINTNRGTAAVALRSIVTSHPELLPDLTGLLERMTDDPSPAVGACVAETLLAVLAIDRDLAVRLFERLTARHPLVAASAPAERLIRYAALTHPEAIVPIVERLLESGNREAEHVGGRQASLAAFATDLADGLAERALMGSVAARFGAAEVYAANVGDSALRTTCAAALKRLFVDESVEVRREAGSCFRAVEGNQLGQLEDLIETFVTSPAIADNAHDVVDALLKTTAQLPNVTFHVCRCLVELAGGEAGSIASAWSAQMPDVAALTIRLHSFGSESARRDALDVIDQLTAVSAYGVREAIEAFERAE